LFPNENYSYEGVDGKKKLVVSKVRWFWFVLKGDEKKQIPSNY